MPRGTKRLVAALFAVAIAVTLFATTTGFDYGNVRWGMTVEEVIRATKAKIDIDEKFGSYSVYEVTRNRFHPVEKYIFNKGKLVCVQGKPDEGVTLQEAFQFIAKTYGKPVATNTFASGTVTNIVFSRGNTEARIQLQDGVMRAISYWINKK